MSRPTLSLPGSVSAAARNAQTHTSGCSAAPAHHFIIGMPDGPTSPGVCKHCGAERDFRNAIDDGSEGVFGLTWRDR